VSDRRHLLRLELAACALAATVFLTMLVFAVDAVRFHRVRLGDVWLSSTTTPLLIVLAFEAAVLLVMAASLTRQVLRQRAFLRRLPTQACVVWGVPVRVIPSRRAHAFCLGLIRPGIYVSDGLLELLSGRELQSVIAHEAHHARRRDPLRRALAKAVSDAFWFIPALRTAASAQVTISELAADAVAAKTAGLGPLASALVTFGDQDGSRAGATPERVVNLLGATPRSSSSSWSTLAATAILLVLGAATVWLLRPVPTAFCLPLSTALGAPLAVAILSLACVPAGLAGRSAARVVGPGSTEIS